ncbi:Spy/CpxP family protein refolding chaperone [Salinarimonas rosea]|uniref:Spy/CpxP family protein refolding chaperone n=1 Tax=Salinarimonas rosea TaxID=552063 RepID=UPI0004122688|nr:Spy/CpxP family protein refolding chaperone [Salinarimonas rosea]
MTTETTPKAPNAGPARSRVSRGLLAAGVAVLGVGAIGAGFAVAQDAPILRHAAGDGPRAETMHARFGEERGRMAEFMEWRLERTLDEVDASPEQVERIKAIAEEARGEIVPLMRGFRDTREDLAEILGAQTIDRAAAETLRAERLAAMDAASARGLQALLDAAEVLEPEQRAELVEEMGERRRGWGRW